MSSAGGDPAETIFVVYLKAINTCGGIYFKEFHTTDNFNLGYSKAFSYFSQADKN